MTDKITALVVGAGGFGTHHARILACLDYKAEPDLPVIDTLAVSRTTLKAAELLAESLSRDDRCTAARIVPVHIDSISELRRVLAEMSPQFISICARDRKEGDTVHASYARAALPFGSVLCEKPFSEATGDGRSSALCRALFEEENAERFGLELPLAVVVRKMLNNDQIRKRFDRAKQVKILWAADIPRKHMIVNDLALHPWSLLYPVFDIAVSHVENNKPSARIDIGLKHRRSGRQIDGRIVLAGSGNLRGIEMDGTTIVFEVTAEGMNLVQTEESLNQIARMTGGRIPGEVILRVENPLKQNILAALRQQPLVGLEDTCAAQLFLEKLHGYFPPDADNI